MFHHFSEKIYSFFKKWDCFAPIKVKCFDKKHIFYIKNTIFKCFDENTWVVCFDKKHSLFRKAYTFLNIILHPFRKVKQKTLFICKFEFFFIKTHPLRVYGNLIDLYGKWKILNNNVKTLLSKGLTSLIKNNIILKRNFNSKNMYLRIV